MALRRIGDTYYDFDTTNTSFIITAKDLKTNGIKNYYFFLRLYDPDLHGVDPYDPNLSSLMVTKIISECIRNPWYYLREVSRIPEQGAGYIQFQINRATLAAIWLFLHGIDTYLTIARQIGKTQSLLAIILWAFLFGTTDSEILFLNIDQSRANANLYRLKRQRELLPEFLKLNFKLDAKTGKMEKGTDNVTSLVCETNKNSIVTKGKATSEEAADGMGRGNTQPIQYIDEFDFIAFIKKILQASGPAYVTASKNAAKNNAVHGRVFTSTPGDLDSKTGKDSIGIINKMYKWSESFYDKPISEVKTIIAKGSENQIVMVEYPYHLLGKDEEWFLSQCRVLENDAIAIKREIFLKRIHGNTSSPYTPEDLDSIDSLKGKIIEELYINKLFKFDIYTKIKPMQIYFVGVDPSDGYGSDNSSITIFDPYTLKNIAEFKSPYISPTDLKNLILVLVQKYMPNSIVNIEQNRGAALISDLLQSPIRHRLYFETKTEVDPTEKLDAKGMMIQEASRRRNFGICTTPKTRPMMFSLLEVYVREHKDAFVLDGLISELFGLIRKNDKVQAGAGFHDDIIMSFLMNLYVYYHGSNLARFGFYPGAIPEEGERNKGLDYDSRDIYNALSDGEQRYFGQTMIESKSQQQLDMDFIKEIQNARNQMSTGDSYGAVTQAVNMDYDESNLGMVDIGLGLFDELNDW